MRAPLLAVLAVSCSGYPSVGPTRIDDPSAPASLTRFSRQGGGSSPLAASIQFGQPDVGSPFPPSAEHDASAHARDNLVPRQVVIAQGGTVTFNVPAGVHQIAIYAPGTKPEDINTAVLVSLCPGPTPRIINDPTNRVALITHTCGSAWQAQYTFNTPGRYLVICAFLPHFEVGMYGWVEVRDRNDTPLNIAGFSPPFTIPVSIATATFPRSSFESATAARAGRGVDYHMQQPRLLAGNVNVQREIVSNVVVMAGYTGSRGFNLVYAVEGSPVVPEVLSDGTKFFPPRAPRRNPHWDSIDFRTTGGPIVA